MSRRWTKARILSKLTEATAKFGRWHGASPDMLSRCDRATFDQDFETYTRAVRRAIRAGIRNHPEVEAWIDARRSLGDYDALRSLKAGLEVDAPGRMDEADLWIAFHAADMVAAGKSIEHIRRSLLRQIKAASWPEGLVDRRGDPDRAQELLGRLRPAVRQRLRTRQNLHKRLVTLGLRTKTG